MCNRTVINIQSVSVKPAAAAENKQITVINSSSFGIRFKGKKVLLISLATLRTENYTCLFGCNHSSICINRAPQYIHYSNITPKICKKWWKSPAALAQAPQVGFIVSIIQRLDPLLPFPLAHLGGVSTLVKPWRQLNKPFWIDHGHLPHVLLCRHHKLMIDDPVWLALEQCAARVDVHWLVFDQGSVSFLGILPGGVEKESCSDGFPYLCEVFPSGDNIKFISAQTRVT